MVENTLSNEQLQADFTDEIARLLGRAAQAGRERELAIKRLAEIGPPAVAPLSQALQHERLLVRRAAARALCAIRDPGAVQPLLQVLYRGAAGTVKVFAKGQVLAVPGIRDALLAALRTGQAVDQASAMAALSYSPEDPEVYRCILRIFHQTHGVDALEALCRMRPERRQHFVAEALRARPGRSRRHAAWLAIQWGLTPPLEVCLKTFCEQPGSVGQRCAEALILKHGEAGRLALGQLWRTGPPRQQWLGAVALTRAGDGDARAWLREQLATGQLAGEKSQLAAGAVARSCRGPALTGLTGPAAGDVAWALRQDRTTATADIEHLYAAGTPAARAAAVRMLAYRQGARFLPELRRCIQAGRPRKVVQEAIRQLIRLRGQAEPVVREMLNSTAWTERKAAAVVLRRWRRLTPEQQAQLAQDPNPSVRRVAARAGVTH